MKPVPTGPLLTRIGVAGIGVATLAAGIALPAAAAVAAPATVYVAPGGVSTNGDTGCSDAAYDSISDAVGADGVAPGGTVVVCKGTYVESVSILKPLTLRGGTGAVINAHGAPYGIGIGADHVTVEGMTVENAKPTKQIKLGDGIITAALTQTGPVPGNHALIVGNRLVHNALNGVDLNTTVGSVATHNVSEHNGVGINLSDDLGAPAHGNRVTDNVASHNVKGCGIVVAEHSGAGIYNNVVSDNTANHNGTGADGAGIFLGGMSLTGGTHDNVLKHNTLDGNTLAGIAVHVHKAGKGKDKADWNGNQLIDNVIGINNLGFKKKGKVVGDYKDNKTTGIYVGAYYPIKIRAENNLIKRDHYGVFMAGKVTFGSIGFNEFRKVAQRSKRITSFNG